MVTADLWTAGDSFFGDATGLVIKGAIFAVAWLLAKQVFKAVTWVSVAVAVVAAVIATWGIGFVQSNDLSSTFDQTIQNSIGGSGGSGQGTGAGQAPAQQRKG